MDDATATVLANLASRTGRPVDEWLDLARARIPLGHKAALHSLKTEFGIGHGYANQLMLVVRAEQAPVDDPVAAQYSGAKAGMRPLYDLLVQRATALGDDVEVAPKKATVSLRRKKQFALLTPATKDRIDLGLNLPGAPGTERLLATGGMCTHKVAVRAAAEVDHQLLDWLREAYDRAG